MDELGIVDIEEGGEMIGGVTTDRIGFVVQDEAITSFNNDHIWSSRAYMDA